MTMVTRSTRPGLLTPALVLVLILFPTDSPAQQASLSGPAQVAIGAPLSIAWTGPGANGDFISIDQPGAPADQYGDYVYATGGNPSTFTAPEVPGRYVIRYHSSAAGYPVSATHALEVTDISATLTAPPSVDAGAELSVTWTGQGYAADFISIDAVGAQDRDYGPYGYASASPATISAPDQAGSYVVRYHLAKTYRVIGQAPLTVGGVSATVSAPVSVPAGGEIEVTWQGPGAPGDYLSIDSVGSPETDYGNYAYTAAGNPVTIRVPETPGAYQVRYHMARSLSVLGSAPLTVAANTATVSGPTTAAGGSSIEVAWTGPDNSGDYVAIVLAGASNLDYETYAYTRLGTPLSVGVPLEPGNCEIRYMTGVRRDVLATAPLLVTPGIVAGALHVVAGPGATRANGAIEVILDASGSMLQRMEGERRIEIARDALTRLVGEVIPEATPFALRVFGHRETDSCRTDLEIPLSPLNRAGATGTIRGVQAMNLARTPIAASLRLVQEDLAGATGPILVVLISDGDETCDGDPMAAIDELRSAGVEVRVNVIGFAIDEHQLREQFESWARAGGGLYVEARNRPELQRAMALTVEVPFEVLSGDEVVATGVVNGDEVSLRPGSYRVRVLQGSTPAEYEAEVVGGETRTVPVS